MANPEVRAVGAIAAGTAAITPGLPAGTLPGDLLFMVAESGGAAAGAAEEANTALTAAGWVEAAVPQKKGNTRLTILYKRATGIDAALTNDTGGHQLARIVGLKSQTWAETTPINITGVGTQAATKSVKIPGATTTVAETLILACASGQLPATTTTAEFGAATNADLGSITERIDNTTAEGDGGAINCNTGTLATAKAYAETTLTAVTEAERGVVSLAVAPFLIPAGPYPTGTAQNGEGTATSREITKPSATETDIIIVEVFLASKTKVISLEGGTSIVQKEMSGVTGRYAKFWIKGGAGNLKVTWEGAESLFHTWSAYALRGCHQTTPIQSQTAAEEKTISKSSVAPTITPGVANCRIQYSSANISGTEATIVTDPNTPQAKSGCTPAGRFLAAAEASGTCTVTLGTERVTCVHTMAVQPPEVAGAQLAPKRNLLGVGI